MSSRQILPPKISLIVVGEGESASAPCTADLSSPIVIEAATTSGTDALSVVSYTDLTTTLYWDGSGPTRGEDMSSEIT